jgi:hypothetical protein
MKLEHIKIGSVYDIKVGKATSAVRITKPIATGGFEAVTLATNKTIVIKSADRIVGPHNPKADNQPKTMTTPDTAKPAPSADAPKHLSLLDAAAKVLAEAKTPLACRQMIDAMTAKSYWQPSQGGKTPCNTLHAAIGTEIKKKGEAARFEKVGRGQFGLRGR